MMFASFSCRSLAWLATIGLCLPSTVVRANEPVSSPPVSTRADLLVHDVALGSGGLLVGQVLDGAMYPLQGAEVAIQSRGQTTATTTTDSNGVFAVAGLHGGVHQVVTRDSIENCRLWTPGTAPPHAIESLRLIPGQGDLVRGQWGPPPGANSFTHNAKMWATNPWVIGGVIATAIAVPIILHNLDDDDDSGS